MAVGDVVNGFGALNTALSFQPAVGVECLITNVGDTSANWIFVTDGVNQTGVAITPNTTASTQILKIFINNSIYLHKNATAGSYNAYNGIQIK